MGEGAPEPTPTPLGGGEGQEQENEQGGVLHGGLGGILGQKKGKICYRGSEVGEMNGFGVVGINGDVMGS